MTAFSLQDDSWATNNELLWSLPRTTIDDDTFAPGCCDIRVQLAVYLSLELMIQLAWIQQTNITCVSWKQHWVSAFFNLNQENAKLHRKGISVEHPDIQHKVSNYICPKITAVCLLCPGIAFSGNLYCWFCVTSISPTPSFTDYPPDQAAPHTPRLITHIEHANQSFCYSLSQQTTPPYFSAVVAAASFFFKSSLISSTMVSGTIKHLWWAVQGQTFWRARAKSWNSWKGAHRKM